jgi:hypothetical protein
MNTTQDDNQLSRYRLCAPGDEFQLAKAAGDDLPKEVSGQPAAYFWKDVIAAGMYRHPGRGFTLAVDRKRLAQWAETGTNMIAAGVAIPINCDHSDAARDCVGYVKEFKIDGDRLMALCQMIGEDAPLLAARNQVSAGIVPDFTDGEGRHWGDAIVHVALTPVPVVSGQEPFIETNARADEQAPMTLTLATLPDLSELSRLREMLAEKDREISALSEATAQAAVRACFATKIDMALSRGAIDKATRDRLGELASQVARQDGSAFLLARNGAGGAEQALLVQLAEILLENRPILHGQATSAQTLSRAIPGEIDSAVLNEFSKYMTAVANRR